MSKKNEKAVDFLTSQVATRMPCNNDSSLTLFAPYLKKNAEHICSMKNKPKNAHVFHTSNDRFTCSKEGINEKKVEAFIARKFRV